MDLTIINEKIENCRSCSLGELLVKPLTPLTSADTGNRIMGVKLCPDMDSHLLSQNLNTREELVLDMLLGRANVPRSDLFLTNLIKCYGAISAKEISDATKICCSHLISEISEVKPKNIVVFGKKTGQLIKRFLKDVEFTELPSLHELFNSPKKFLLAVDAMKSMS